MSAIGESSSSSNSLAVLRGDTLRRKLQIDLKEIEKALFSVTNGDRLTDALQRWHQDFLFAVRREDNVESVEKFFISAAQGTLLDAISNIPLDEEALLGSDGRVYSKKSLIVHFFKYPPGPVCRSPLEPENPLPFTVSPHFPARAVAKWLKKQNALREPELFEEAYREAVRDGLKPLPWEGPSISPMPSSQVLHDSRESRKIISDLLKIQETLQTSKLHDETTEQLRNWQKRFSSALKLNLDKVRIEAEFILLLQEILTDSVSGAPLDEEAYLGSDGRTYGSMSLSLYQHSAPEEYKHRSPLDLENPAPFTVEPHPLARHLIQWLKERGALLRSESVEKSYQELMQQRIAPPPPTTRNERIRRLKEKQAHRDQIKEARLLAERETFNQIIEETREQTAQMIRESFADIDQRAEETTERQIEQIHAQVEHDREQLRLLREEIANADERARRLDARTIRLRERQEEAERALDQAKRDNFALRIAINETRQALNKMQAKRRTNVLGTVLCLAGWAFGSWALQSVLTTMGASMGATIMPLKGGAMIALSTSRHPIGPSHRDTNPSKPPGLSRGNHF